MKILSRRDTIYAIATGLTAGILGHITLASLDASIAGIPSSWLIVVIPILWLLGVQLGYFLGRWIGFFDSFGKYAAIGFTNFAVYSAILRLESYLSGITEGGGVALLTSVAFALATLHGYFWNKYWSFDARTSQNSKREFILYWVVSLISLGVNSGTAYGVVNFVTIPGVITPEQWLSLGGIIGSAAALIFSFVGFKLIVFKNHALPTVSAKNIQ